MAAIALTATFGLSLYLLPILGGAVFTYAWITAAIAFMGKCVYDSHRESPPEAPTDDQLTSSYLDVVDVILVFTSWLPVVFLLESLGVESRAQGSALLLGCGVSVMWLRRRFFPNSTVPFHPKNLVLRVLSIFCALHAVITLGFALFSRMYDTPDFLIWVFGLSAGGLLAVSAWARRTEFLRYPSLSVNESE